MATKHITDKQVVEAFIEARKTGAYPYDILVDWTAECRKVCYRAMERACDRGFIEYGVSLRCGWVTDKGMELLKS